MALDVRTIVVTLAVSAVLMALTLLLGVRVRGPGLGRWNLGLAMFALGWTLIALRDVLPAAVSVALADALLLAGLTCQSAALADFDGHAVKPRDLYGAPLLLFCALLPVLDRYALVTTLASFFYAVALAALALASVRLGAGAGGVRWLMSALFSVAAVAVVARAIAVALYRPDVHSVFDGSALHAATFMLLLAVMVGSSFGFVLMHGQRTEDRLQRLASHDPLTGLYNRRAFLDLATRELARSRRANAPLAALMLDLDHFKKVNDLHGHAAGDRVLAAFAETLRASLRTGDIAGRYGGEEFCVLLSAADRDSAQRTAERIRAAVAAAALGGIEPPVTVSIGVAPATSGVTTLDDILAAADMAMYEAKRAGRNRVFVQDDAPLAARQPPRRATHAQEVRVGAAALPIRNL